MAEAKDDKVKVVDRRWFTVEGDLKEPTDPPAAAAPSPPEPPPPPPPAPPAARPDDVREKPAARPSSPSAVGFLDVVDFLAQQAAALLSGQIPGRGRDPETARFFIEMLAVVQGKTTGQLSDEEARYLDDVLYQLRSLFVAATG